MPGTPNAPRHPRLASGPQLWRLNTLGRLGLVDGASPISSSHALTAIGAELERPGLSRFPRQTTESSGSPDSTTRDRTQTQALKAPGRGWLTGRR
jgi:hypothetical protein